MNKLFEYIEEKLELFQVQLGRATLTHFMCLAASKMEFPDLDSTSYAANAHSYAMSSQGSFQGSDEMRLKHSCLIIHLI